MAGYIDPQSAMDLLRSLQVRGAVLEESLEESGDPQDFRSNPEQLSVASAQTQIIQKSLAQIPPDQRHTIELAYFSGLSQSEIAAPSGLPLGTVKTGIRLGMVRLRELLTPYAEEL